MSRTPLRPLARILKAREEGENPKNIERENLRQRHEDIRETSRTRAEGRLVVLGLFFVAAFSVVGMRMGHMAATDPVEPTARTSRAPISANRADIVDRNGRIMATNLSTHSLYVETRFMVDKPHAATELVKIFPDLNEEKLLARLNGKQKFFWLKRQLSPEQMQAVHEIGEPGLRFGPREMRLYPNGSLAAHILGGATYGREGVNAAEVIGEAGVERMFDDYLRDPANGGAPLTLSLDLSIQSAVRTVLYGGMKLMDAKGATAILMDVHSGELVAMTSLPDFDPNDRPHVAVSGDASDSPLFNRAVQGVYELGSTFKIFTAAQMLEEGLAAPTTMIKTQGPLRWGKHRIRDFHDYGATLSVTDVIVKSSNIGTARMAQAIGVERQQDFLNKLGMLTPTEVELAEASSIKPLLPPNWSELSAMTISYGHGLSASPLHLATAYASLLNGGTKVTPTLIKQNGPVVGERIVSERTSAMARAMLRQVVVRGTASFGDVTGYAVGGKTGTADKPLANGRGYHEESVIATFASVFPAHDPKYVLIVTLDEPEVYTYGENRRTAGWTAVPVASEIVQRVAPLLGLRPEIEPPHPVEVTLVKN